MSSEAATSDVPKMLYDTVKTFVENFLVNRRDRDGVIALVEATENYAAASRLQFLDPSTPPVACQEKCDWCCHQSVRVSAPEVFRITRHIQQLPSLQQQRMLDDLVALDQQSHGLNPHQRGQLNRACAFLKNGGCSIYPVRPLACQTMSSFSVEDCQKAKPLGFPFGSVKNEKARYIVYGSVISGMRAGFAAALPPQASHPLELTAAMIVGLRMEDAFEQWLDGQPVFQAAELTL